MEEHRFVIRGLSVDIFLLPANRWEYQISNGKAIWERGGRGSIVKAIMKATQDVRRFDKLVAGK